ncbi:winged helix-turn-helix transcriptional regulator [Gordonibacter sp. An230]|uniref:winged helix-turn-helix transcriptional regulator n=1 Tax=Gordonibacter sp. An230 TaxID=1965592 RepID=UPI001EF6EF64|nr:winged helix-turn-helix transcriptional regulator [Gordonibacter sp. An230]
MDAFEGDPRATVNDVAERIGSSKRTVERAIASLKDEGRMRRIGSPRAGRWEMELTQRRKRERPRFDSPLWDASCARTPRNPHREHLETTF